MSRIFREQEGPPAGTGGSGGERPPAQTPPAGETPPAQTPPPTPAQPASPSARGAATHDDGDVDLSDLPEQTPDPVRRIIRQEREARRDAEKRARESAGELDRLKRAEMSESERLTADNARLQGDVQRLTEEARGRAVREAVAELAPTLGIADPRLASRLLDSSKVEWGDDGQPKRKPLEKTLEALKAEYPSIAARTRGSADAGAGASSGPNDSDISARIRARIRGE